ncbi:MAG: hypothetical protein N2248_02680 [candidate division WOR-3 bacterium]|uniref:T9SS type A sorting domain-containing protein n=1 Tax=candidate division WOR-3 bacterium TaxID=2052148 RepID=A0A7C1NBI6_UNCW3|nr:hypothetical protein [candidate division WOR-3 bacterium]
MCYNSAIVLGPDDGFSQPVYVVFENDSFAGSVIVQQDIYFQRSTDGGLTWLSEDRLLRRGVPFACYPDIAVDRNGIAYVVWQDWKNGRGEIWFSTNRLTSVTESDASTSGLKIECAPTVFRSRSYFNISGKIDENAIVKIYDLSGRAVRSLRICEGRGFWDGCDDAGKRLNAGVYLLRAGTAVVRLLLLP